MTATTLPAQASISTASGWTVTVTHAGLQNHWHSYHAWHMLVVSPNRTRFVDTLGLATPASGEPNPLEALEIMGRWMRDPEVFTEVPDEACAEIADAIAAMYGDKQACDDCHAGPGEPCHVDCSSRWGE